LAEEGFKRKLTEILSADVEGYSRLMYGPEEPMPHNLTTYCTSMTDLASNTGYRMNGFLTRCI
jgi:hypothetical protein